MDPLNTKWVIFYDDANLGCTKTNSNYVWLAGYLFTNLNDVKKLFMQSFQYNPKTKKNELININETPSAIIDNRFIKYQKMYGSDYQFNYNSVRQKSNLEFEKRHIYYDWLIKNNKIIFSFEPSKSEDKIEDEIEDEIKDEDEVENEVFTKWFNLEGYQQITHKLLIVPKTNPNELLDKLEQKEKKIDEVINSLEYGILKDSPFYLNYDANQLFICKFIDFQYEYEESLEKNWAFIFVPKKFLNQLFDISSDDDDD